jgi:hypothetical protein
MELLNEQNALGGVVVGKRRGLESLLFSMRSADVTEYPELQEQVLRVAAGVSALERQIDTAINCVREQIRETERELRKGKLDAHSLGA